MTRALVERLVTVSVKASLMPTWVAIVMLNAVRFASDIPSRAQEHQHDCTPNDFLAAYAALAQRPLAAPAAARFTCGRALLYARF